MTELLSESSIKVPLSGATNKAICRELIGVLFPLEDDVVRQEILTSVVEREATMSTAIGNGIAIPHGTLPAGMGFAMALGIPAQPLDFDSMDGLRVEMVFLIVADPEHLMTKMKALARISRFLHRDAFRRGLAGSASAAAAMRVIVDEEARHRI